MLNKLDIQNAVNLINAAPIKGGESEVVAELKKKLIAMFESAPDAPKVETPTEEGEEGSKNDAVR